MLLSNACNFQAHLSICSSCVSYLLKFVSLLIEEFSEISASSIYFVSIFLSRWTGCPKSGQREQHFPLMLSPCWIISPQICTPCPSSALPLQLWTVRAALHGPTLRESTSPSTGRWVYTHTFFFWKIWTNRIFFFFFLLKRLNHFRHKNAFSLVSCGLFLCNLSFFFFFFKVYLWRFYGLDCQAPLHCCQDLP